MNVSSCPGFTRTRTTTKAVILLLPPRRTGPSRQGGMMAPNPAGVYVASAGLRCCNIVLVTSSGGRAEPAGSSAVIPALGGGGWSHPAAVHDCLLRAPPSSVQAHSPGELTRCRAGAHASRPALVSGAGTHGQGEGPPSRQGQTCCSRAGRGSCCSVVERQNVAPGGHRCSAGRAEGVQRRIQRAAPAERL